MKKFLLMLFTLLFAVLNGWAQTQYVNALGASTGWYSDDTRDAAGADLVGLTKTLYGKPFQTPTAADDIAIGLQIPFVAGPAGGTYGGAVKIDGTTSNSGKSTISTVNLSGFAPASDLVGGSFTATYLWYMEPVPTTRTLAFRIGVQSAQWIASQTAFTAIRSGEPTWDLKLVNLMSSPSPNAWNSVTVDMNNGLWYLFGQAGNTNWPGIAGSAPPGGAVQQTLAQWQADPIWGPILFGPGSIVTNIGMGLGSGQRQCNAYIDYLQTSLLNSGNVIDFTGPVHNVTQNLHYPAIQPAINAANPGDEIHVAAGTYQESLGGWRDLEIFKSLILKGAGSGQTIVEFSNLQHGLEIHPDATGNLYIEGITFTKKAANTSSAGWAILVAETGGTFNNLTFKDVEVAYASARNLHFASATYGNILIEN